MGNAWKIVISALLFFAISFFVFPEFNNTVHGQDSTSNCSGQTLEGIASELESRQAKALTDLDQLRALSGATLSIEESNEIKRAAMQYFADLRVRLNPCRTDADTTLKARAEEIDRQLVEFRSKIEFVSQDGIDALLEGSWNDFLRAVRATATLNLHSFFAEQLIKTIKPELTNQINKCEGDSFDVYTFFSPFLRPICGLMILANEGLAEGLTFIVTNLQETFSDIIGE